jgi:hypothetical protein
MINPAAGRERPETAVQPGVLLARRIVPGSPFCTSAFIMSMGVSQYLGHRRRRGSIWWRLGTAVA